ncbi:MAG: hypothetical protein JWM11_2050, partial [Planctomycetaceae bacterium]|nr:hypothetical protein [Planctomycetaceae bacterium]
SLPTADLGMQARLEPLDFRLLPLIIEVLLKAGILRQHSC